MTRRWLAVVLLPLVAACGRAEPRRPEAAAGAARSLETVVVRRAEVPRSFEAGGSVRAAVTAEIVSRIMAPVRARPVVAGQRVAAGAPLVILDGRQQAAELARAQAGHRVAAQSGDVARAGLARAEAQLALATRTHARMATLHAKKSSTDQELDRAKTELVQATADVEAARSAVSQASSGLDAAKAAESAADIAQSYTVLRAPFDGVVTETRIDPGSMAVPGTPLLILEDPRRYRLHVRIDEARANAVRGGAVVRVRLGESGGDDVEGRVAEVARVLDAAHTFLVQIDLPTTPTLRSGLFGTAAFEGPSRDAMVVPTSAVVRNGQLTSVFVVADGTARMRLVRLGAETGAGVEVMAGIDVGEVVVVRPDNQVTDGTTVTPRGGEVRR